LGALGHGADVRGMTVRRSIVALCLLAALAFAVLMFSWPVMKEVYPASFRAVGGVAFTAIGLGERVELVANPNALEGPDSFVRLRTGANEQVQTPFDSRFIGYLPTAVLIALIAATRTTFGRRKRRLLWGLVLVHAYVFANLCLLVLVLVVGHRRECPRHPGGGFLAADWVHSLVNKTLSVIQHDPGVYITFPVLVWALLSFDRDDWVRRTSGDGS
jgi:hypothetical protein